MKTSLAALASALVAATALASAAEAGGGVRLGFGGPLGTFVATPSHGGSSYEAPKASRKAPVAQAARKPENAQAARKPENAQRIVKAEPEPKADAAGSTETAGEEAARVTGSSALIQGSIPVQEQDGAATKAEAPADATATAEVDPAASGTCRKFVPEVGTVVSVGCGE